MGGTHPQLWHCTESLGPNAVVALQSPHRYLVLILTGMAISAAGGADMALAAEPASLPKPPPPSNAVPALAAPSLPLYGDAPEGCGDAAEYSEPGAE